MNKSEEKNLYLESFVFSWEELNKTLNKINKLKSSRSQNPNEFALQKKTLDRYMSNYYTFLKRIILDLEQWMNLNKEILLTNEEARYFDSLPEDFIFNDEEKQSKHLFRLNEKVLKKAKERMLQVFGEENF